MSRIQTVLRSLAENKRKALIPFITAGDPYPEFTVPAMHALVQAGADIIELGVPFSDPMADGPVIQRASERALAHRMSLRKVLGLVGEFRSKDSTTPVVLMGYLNPIEALGYEKFAAEASAAGADGVLTVDMPFEEAGEFLPMLHEHGLDPIFLLSPNSTPERVREIGRVGRGYLYYVSLKGVTGATHLDIDDVERKLSEIRSLTSLPIGVGFGVKDQETAQSIARFADAVVVGSALISRIERGLSAPAEQTLSDLANFVRELRSAIDSVQVGE